VNIQPNIVTCPTYPDEFTRDNVVASFVPTAVVIVTLPGRSDGCVTLSDAAVSPKRNVDARQRSGFDRRKGAQCQSSNRSIFGLIIPLCPLRVWRTVLRALDLRLEIAGSIPAAALLGATLGKLSARIASVTKQYNLVPA